MNSIGTGSVRYMKISLAVMIGLFLCAYLLSASTETKRLIVLGGFVQVLVFFLFHTYANRAIKAYRNLYRTQQRLIENANEAIAIHEVVWNQNRDGISDYTFLQVNHTFESFTGLLSGDILGKTVLEVLPETEAFWLKTYGDVVVKQQKTSFINYSEAIGKYFRITAYPISKNEFVTLFLDITDQLNHEQQLKQALKEAEKAIGFKNQFMRDVNHKLRTPLNAMMGLAQLISMEPMASSAKELFEVMLQEMGNSRNILNQIAEYINLKDEAYQITENDMLKDVEEVRYKVAPEAVTVACEVAPEELEKVYYERQVFKKVLKTLLYNAKSHSGSDRVQVTIEKDPSPQALANHFKVSVKDYGKGIEADKMDMIFNEMHHEDFVHIYREEGHVSLPLCKAMMTHIGGDLTCSSSQEEGAVFSMKLPYFGHVNR